MTAKAVRTAAAAKNYQLVNESVWIQIDRAGDSHRPELFYRGVPQPSVCNGVGFDLLSFSVLQLPLINHL